MKKSSKPFIVYALFIFITVTVLILGFVGVKLENENMAKAKIRAEEKLQALRNSSLVLTAEHQNYSSEEMIVQTAVEQLKMMRPFEPAEVRYADKEKIKMIDQFLSEKYE